MASGEETEELNAIVQKSGPLACFICSKGPLQEDVLRTLICQLMTFTHVLTASFAPSSPSPFHLAELSHVQISS